MTPELTMARGNLEPDSTVGRSMQPSRFVNTETFRLFEETVAELTVTRCQSPPDAWRMRPSDIGQILAEACLNLDISMSSMSLEEVKQLLVATLQVVKQIVPPYLRDNV